MSHKKRGHYSEKHPPGKKPDPRIEEAVKKKAKQGELPCAVAHSIAKDLGVPPEEVGFAMDMLGISITKCQLGLFGYRPERKILKPAKDVSEDLRKEIENSVEEGRIPCKKIWQIAERLGIGKMEVASACEALGIKISRCQLGAF